MTNYREACVRVTSEDGSPKTTKVTLEDGTELQRVESVEIHFGATRGTEAIIHCMLPSLDILVPAEIHYRDRLLDNLSYLTHQLMVELYKADMPRWLVHRREQLQYLLQMMQHPLSLEDLNEDSPHDH